MISDKIDPFYPAAPDFKTDWKLIYNSFEWIRAMEGVPQNPVFHGEGDVLAHTKMVCEALTGIKEWRHMGESERLVLFLAALFHDVAKPYCTRTEMEGITSRGHALKGELMTRRIIYTDRAFNSSITFCMRETVAKLVRYHGLPLFFLDKPDPVKAVIEASQMISLDWLDILAKADVLGRECNDRNELIEKIDLFSGFCEEQGCYKSPYKFHDDYSRFIYFQKENAMPDYAAYDDTKFEVIIMSGLPASGKDTWVKKNCCGLPVISLDDIRDEMDISPRDEQGEVIYKAREEAKKLLRAHNSFVWNATNLTASLRRQLISLFTSYGARVKIVYIEAPYQEMLRRNSERDRTVPENVINRMIGKLEVPNITEAHEVRWVVDY